MKNILCFGDSNTFGDHPEGGRYTREQRWTGILQKTMGDEYYIIEEGVSGRTTVWDDPIQEHRCGVKALPISLLTHKPIDLVIIFLGSNDLKSMYPAEPPVIGRSVERLVEVVRTFPYGEAYVKEIPQVLVVSPPLVGDDIDTCPYPQFNEKSRADSHKLAPIYEAVAKKCNCHFLDIAKYAEVGKDQIHITAESHVRFAAAFAEKITDIFKD